MRQRRDFERPEGKKSARLVVIAAEGKETENIYFEAMKRLRQASNVHVEILHRDDDASSPSIVYQQINQFKQEYNIEEDDQLWIVVDRDKWPVKMIKSVAQFCNSDQHLNFCMSNPCFELWLLLHIEDVSSLSEDVKDKMRSNKKKSKRGGDTFLKKRLRNHLGSYQESNYDAERLIATVDDAITRADALDTNKQDRWPQDLGTRVYLLARTIMDNDLTT